MKKKIITEEFIKIKCKCKFNELTSTLTDKSILLFYLKKAFFSVRWLNVNILLFNKVKTFKCTNC